MSETSEGLKRTGSCAVADGEDFSTELVGDFSPLYSTDIHTFLFYQSMAAVNIKKSRTQTHAHTHTHSRYIMLKKLYNTSWSVTALPSSSSSPTSAAAAAADPAMAVMCRFRLHLQISTPYYVTSSSYWLSHNTHTHNRSFVRLPPN